jgi:hypothetical protein
MKLKNIMYNEQKDDPYAMPYLLSLKPFSRPLDYTKYEFQGKIYAKKWLVLAVITEHIRLHPQATLKSLQKDFEVINKWGWPVEILYSYEDAIKRGLEMHCLFDNALVLNNGEKIVVSECGMLDIINAFNKKALIFGYDIKVIEQY